MGKYDDIINLPHHVSATRPRMSMIDRAAQFSPFAALTGYDAAIKETGRLTDRRIELTEDSRAAMDRKQQLLVENLADHPEVSVTYFVPDERKAGGAYITVTGRVIVWGGGTEAVYMNNDTSMPELVVCRVDEAVKVIFDKASTVAVQDNIDVTVTERAAAYRETEVIFYDLSGITAEQNTIM